MSDDIVVGLDDSAAATAALRWAAQQARLTGCRLWVIHVLDWPTGVRADGVRLVDDWVYAQEASQETTRRARMTELFDAVHPRPDWSLDFAQGKAGVVLVRAAQNAGLLVVGTGEHGGLSRVLIGSTSHYCLSHASCPVVAVPAASLPGSASVGEEAAAAVGQGNVS